MSPEIFTTRAANIWIRDDGITQVVVLPHLQEELEDSKENIALISKINHGKSVPLLVDVRPGPGINRESRIYYSSNEAVEETRALAVLVESPFQRVMANFFIGVNKPSIPTRLFTSEGEAIAWLKTFLD